MKPNVRMTLVLFVAVVRATLASYGAYLAIQRIQVREVEIEGQPVVVASHQLPVGTLITPRDVKIVNWPADNQVPNGFSTTEEVLDRGLMASLVPNEPLTESKLAPREAGGGLPTSIPSGMRAVSVHVNEVIGVAGFTVPGTRVDVLVTVGERKESMSRIVVSNLQVLTAGTRYDMDAARADAEPIPSTVVTLLVTPNEAERVALATTQGKILLTLRNPLDQNAVETDGVRFAALMGAPAPPPVTVRVNRQTVVVPPPAAPKPYTVEAIRGGRRGSEVVERIEGVG